MRNVSILIALLMVFILGLWGQFELHPERLRHDTASVLYEVIMLFVLEGDWTRGHELPWQLEIARFLAPLVSIGGVLIVLTQGAWVRLSNFTIRFWDDHVIVVGLGEKGYEFARSCTAHHRVVVIEREEDHLLVERARTRGIRVVIGDALDQRTMRQANVLKARHLVTFCGNDGDSVEIALRTRRYLQQHATDRELRIHLHVGATRVSSRLENYAKFYDENKVATVDFFSVNDLTARILLKKYPPDVYADAFGQAQVHIAIYNFGSLAEQILTETVRICHLLAGHKVRFSIFDPKAEEKVAMLLSLHPALETLCEIQRVSLSALLPLQLEHVDPELLRSVTQHVVCLDSDDQNLEFALMLREILLRMQGCNSPINVRMQRASGLANLLESADDEPEIPDGIYPFGMLNEVLFYDNVLSDRLDELARAMHEDYLARRKLVDTDHRLYRALNTWNDLPEPERKSNRLQADHLAAKLRAVRCLAEKGPPNQFEFTAVEAEALARMEHNRWRSNKIYEGWRQGDQRIEGAKINPYAVAWDALDPVEKAQQIEAIHRLPGLLQDQLGWRIRRELYVGVTGHRPNRADLGNGGTVADIEKVLADIARDYPDRHIVVVSALAEGADRVVARIAMDKYRMGLHVALPLPFELYQTDFESRESLQEFKTLVGRAELYFELPMRFGTIETLASNVDGTSNPARDRQYALAGAYVVQTCNELVAIYDGAPSAGVGGTAEVVRWRNDQAVPPDFQFAAANFLRPILKPPIVIAPSPPAPSS
ncbi:MAG: NAD-binding protein [Pseudomonadota bacterium]